MQLLTTFEHSYIFREKDLPAACFDWLLNQQFKFLVLASKQGRLCFKTQQYVGVIATPYGTQVEILPKIFQGINDESDIAHSRVWLTDVLNKQFIKQAKIEQNSIAQQTVLQSTQNTTSLHQWLLYKYTELCNEIVAHGMSSQYQTQANNDSFLRGKLNVRDNIRDNQMRQRQHQFAQTTQIRNNVSPENRIITFALIALAEMSRSKIDIDNTMNRLMQVFIGQISPTQDLSAVELANYLMRQYQQDSQEAEHKRLPTAYAQALPLAHMILRNLHTGSGLGNVHGLSLLFDMHSLFETMVEEVLNRLLQIHKKFDGHSLSVQMSSQHLLDDSVGKKHFKLRPDFIIREMKANKASIIIDAKWKLLTENAIEQMSQADVYQMFAYGMHYFDVPNKINSQSDGTRKEIWLIYPKTQTFQSEHAYQFAHSNMCLRVLPFDLQKQEIMGV